uniref:Uncharacterized protein n=1 Tax=Solanum tuberosum TaxID=4113 RepID=M1BQZ8_SOLTU
MGDNNDEVGLTDVVMAQPAATDQNELIMQLMQQIAEMRVEMQRRQDLSNPIFAFNTPGDRRPPLYFPPSNAEHAHNPPSNPAQNPSTIDPTAPNPHQASVSYQAPPPPQVSDYDFSENIFKSVNIMSCHKLNEQNEVDADEFKDYNEKIMVPKHLVEEFRQFESHDKQNSEETGIVNQENDECIKEIKTGAYLTKAQERELTSFLKEDIETFV